jgi:hypothetical protein
MNGSKTISKKPPVKDVRPTILLDGVPLKDWKSLEIVYDVDIPGADDSKGSLNIVVTPNGLIADVWESRQDEFDTNAGTSSETAQELAERLCAANS